MSRPWFVQEPGVPPVPVGMQPNAPQPTEEELRDQRRAELGWVAQEAIRKEIRVVNGAIASRRDHYPKADARFRALREKLMLGVGEAAKRLGLPMADVVALETGAARMEFETYSALLTAAPK